MEDNVISESVLSAAAIILVLLGRSHIGVPMGANKIMEELLLIFKTDRRLCQRSCKDLFVPS